MIADAILKSKGANVISTRQDGKVSEVVRTLSQERIGVVVVSDDGEQLNGIISERDVVRGLGRHGAALMDMPARELMTKEVQTCGRSNTLPEIMTQMSEHRIRHLPVLEDGKLCGLLSISDVVRGRLQEIEAEAAALRDYVVGRG